MKLSIYSVLLALVLTAFANPSLAQQRPGRPPGQPPGRPAPPDWDYDRRAQTLMIHMYDEVFYDRGTAPGRGPSRAPEIRLKALIQQQYPRLRLMDMELIEVRMMAKSAEGRGLAQLMLDRYPTDRQRVGIHMGRRDRNLREAFEYGGPETFDYVQLFANNAGDARTWQINLSGLIKVRSLEVVLREDRRRGGQPDNRRPGYGRIETVHVGSMRPEQFFTEVKHFRVYEPNAVEVSLEGLRRETMVESVEVQYRRGPSEFLYNLTGVLNRGQLKTARLSQGSDVTAIIVRAQSVRLFKGEGEIKVSVGSLR